MGLRDTVAHPSVPPLACVAILVTTRTGAGPMIASVMLAALLAAPVPGAPAQMMARLQAKTPIVDDLQALTDTVGGRPTGSAAFDQSVVWATSRLRDAGLANVHSEDFAMAHGWLPRVETATVIVPASVWETSRALKVASLPLSASTP